MQAEDDLWPLQRGGGGGGRDSRESNIVVVAPRVQAASLTHRLSAGGASRRVYFLFVDSWNSCYLGRADPRPPGSELCPALMPSVRSLCRALRDSYLPCNSSGFRDRDWLTSFFINIWYKSVNCFTMIELKLFFVNPDPEDKMHSPQISALDWIMVRFIRSVTPTINRIKSSKKSNIFLQRSINPPTQFPLSEVFFSSAKGNFGTYKNTFGPHCKRWALIHISLPFKTISVEQQYKAILDTVCCFLIIYEQYRGAKKCKLLVNMI